MAWTTGPTPFCSPVFVAGKNDLGPDGAQATQKPRVIIDVRQLNSMVTKDSYPGPVQERC
jgi:hypothetical protein